jgi:hypothetical protein
MPDEFSRLVNIAAGILDPAIAVRFQAQNVNGRRLTHDDSRTAWLSDWRDDVADQDLYISA